MPRHHAPADGIVTARLNGTARRLLREKADVETCLAELHAITTDPRRLGIAAGTALGAWRATRSYDSDRVARMLEAAGADPLARDEAAANTVARLQAESRRPGDRDAGLRSTNARFSRAASHVGTTFSIWVTAPPI